MERDPVLFSVFHLEFTVCSETPKLSRIPRVHVSTIVIMNHNALIVYMVTAVLTGSKARCRVTKALFKKAIESQGIWP